MTHRYRLVVRPDEIELIGARSFGPGEIATGFMTLAEARVTEGLPADGLLSPNPAASAAASHRSRASRAATKRGKRSKAKRGRR
jgi:hypothetical protein